MMEAAPAAMLRRVEKIELDSSAAPGLRGPTGLSGSGGPRQTLTALFAVAAVTAAVHGWSLFDGLALDDHWHYRTIQSCGWSPGELLATTTIRVEDLVKTWWQAQSVCFEYARPISVALMKMVYAATGGSVVAQHVCSVMLHVLAAMLVHRLCLLLTGNSFWSMIGAMLFAVYPNSVFAVGWLAAQNMLLLTVLMLAALLAYVRASGLCLHIDSPGSAAVVTAPPLKRGALAGAIALWTGALLSRENAIMLPVVVVLFDLAFGGWRHCRARLTVYAVFALVGIAFLIWRFGFFYERIPDVYVRRPDGNGYALWLAAKLLHYLACSVWLAPMIIGPTGRYRPFVEAPFDCALMSGIVLSAAVLFWLAARHARGYWIWPVWMLLAIGPVLPILATPHSGYLCGVPVAIGFVLGPVMATRGVRRKSFGGWCGVAAIVALTAYSAFDKANRLMWRGMYYAEHFVTESFPAEPPPEGVSDIYLLNLPFAAIYVPQNMRFDWPERSSDISWHVLTFAPDVVRMEQSCVIRQIDDHRFTIRTEGRPYFSGLLGRFLVNGFGRDKPFAIGQHFDQGAFAVEILDADAEGVWELHYVFRKPLSDPSQQFYVTSGECGAMPLRFDRSEVDQRIAIRPGANPPTVNRIAAAAAAIRAGDIQAGDAILAALNADDAEVRNAAREATQATIEIVARATATPVLALLEYDRLDDEEITRAGAWWHGSVDSAALRRLFERRDRLREVRDRRDELVRGPALVGRYVRSDLYLNSRPFPGPRP